MWTLDIQSAANGCHTQNRPLVTVPIAPLVAAYVRNISMINHAYVKYKVDSVSHLNIARKSSFLSDFDDF